MKIDGKQIASEILDDLKTQVSELKKKGITPTLAIILIGDDAASHSYIKQKKLKASEIGAEIKLFHFGSTSEVELLKLITDLNNDPSIHGIIVQRPLPDSFDRDKISQSIETQKDVDGFNTESEFDAPVALGVIEILNSIGLKELSSKKIVVLGKGETAGRPIIKLLDKMEISFEVIDRKTTNPDELIKNADIIISAVGRENVIKPEILNSDQVLIGLGLFLKDGKLKGDYEEPEVEGKVKSYTPTLGGVGPVNVACLMKNLIQAASPRSIITPPEETTGN
jgi:methylenetetrahydrofolate dehydrogenase (NADP+) / methenyltetrahydrofolate cyclohydrolase